MTVFSLIIEGKIESKRLYENEWLIAIHDIEPKAPVHILIIPKKPIINLQSMEKEDFPLLSEVVKAAQYLAEEFEIEEGYRLLTNNGKDAGQTVFHLHFHLLGGAPLGPIA